MTSFSHPFHMYTSSVTPTSHLFITFLHLLVALYTTISLDTPCQIKVHFFLGYRLKTDPQLSYCCWDPIPPVPCRRKLTTFCSSKPAMVSHPSLTSSKKGWQKPSPSTSSPAHPNTPASKATHQLNRPRKLATCNHQTFRKSREEILTKEQHIYQTMT